MVAAASLQHNVLRSLYACATLAFAARAVNAVRASTHLTSPSPASARVRAIAPRFITRMLPFARYHLLMRRDLAIAAFFVAARTLLMTAVLRTALPHALITARNIALCGLTRMARLRTAAQARAAWCMVASSAHHRFRCTPAALPRCRALLLLLPVCCTDDAAHTRTHTARRAAARR
jgi:hypothetical protein